MTYPKKNCEATLSKVLADNPHEKEGLIHAISARPIINKSVPLCFANREGRCRVGVGGSGGMDYVCSLLLIPPPPNFFPPPPLLNLGSFYQYSSDLDI